MSASSRESLGIGPQFGYIFPISPTLQGYINLKAYGEFDHSDRPDGWNAWVTLVISPAAPTPRSRRQWSPRRRRATEPKVTPVSHD